MSVASLRKLWSVSGKMPFFSFRKPRTRRTTSLSLTLSMVSTGKILLDGPRKKLMAGCETAVPLLHYHTLTDSVDVQAPNCT